jgi:hypothetical protein
MPAPDGQVTAWSSPNVSWTSPTVSWTGTAVVQHSYTEGFVGEEGPPTIWHEIVNFAEAGERYGSNPYYR